MAMPGAAQALLPFHSGATDEVENLPPSTPREPFHNATNNVSMKHTVSHKPTHHLDAARSTQRAKRLLRSADRAPFASPASTTTGPTTTFFTPAAPTHHQPQYRASRTAAASKNLTLLKRSTYQLERLLSERKHKEFKLESKLQELETDLKRSKDKSLRAAVSLLSTSLFLLLAGGLSYASYRMFSPHFDSILMAGLVSSILRDHPARSWLETHLQLAQANTFGVSVTFSLLVATLSGACYLGTLAAPPHYPSALLAAGAGFAASYSVCRSVLRVHYKSSAAALLTVFVTLSLIAPLGFVLQRGAREADNVAKSSFALLESETEIGRLIHDLRRVTPIRWILESIQLHGDNTDEVRETIKSTVRAAADAAKSNSRLALDLLSNLSTLLWHFGTFSAMLFSALRAGDDFNSPAWIAHLTKLSPLPWHDNREVYRTVMESTKQVLVGSLAIGLAHGLATYTVLHLVGAPMAVLPAFVSACLAVAPLFGTFVVWLPFALGFYVRDCVWSAAAVVLVELVVSFILEPLLLSHFPVNSQLLGLPIVAGLYAFGPFGIVYGPLVVNLSTTLTNIYVRFVGDNSILSSSAGGLSATGLGGSNGSVLGGLDFSALSLVTEDDRDPPLVVEEETVVEEEEAQPSPVRSSLRRRGEGRRRSFDLGAVVGDASLIE